MDVTLSEFIEKTSCEPGFAQDLLRHHDWNLGAALKSFYQFSLIDQKDTNLTNGDKNENMPINNSNNIICNGNGLSTKDIFMVSNKCTSEPSLSSQSSDTCDSSVLSSPTNLTNKFKYKKNDLFLEKKLFRGISRASDNENLISKARSEVAQDFKSPSPESRLLNLVTFILPDISSFENDFCDFLKKDLIEKSTLNSLESSKRLNWWSDICHNLYPLVTSGDGNCLLHAASLGMWGFHDRELILRKELNALISKSPYSQAFYRRWRWQTHFQNCKVGLTLTENEWKQEWENVVRMASTEPRSKKYDYQFEMSGGKKEPNDYEEKSFIYESLEEIHIFVLAHVLRRPIIVIADTMLKDLRGEAFHPIHFGGIYLPLERSDNCFKSPLCLTFDSAHFSALVSMNKKEEICNELPLAIPLMDADHNILPLHFAIDPGKSVFTTEEKPGIDNVLEDLSKTLVLNEQDKYELLRKYFDIVTLAHKRDNYVEKEIPSPPSTKIITNAKSQTLPSDFGRKNEFQNFNQIGDKFSKNRNVLSRSSAKHLLQKPFVSFGKMGKCIKKNLGNLARRSTSFRSNSKPNNNDLPVINDQTTDKSSSYLVVEKNETANQKESIICTDNSTFYCDTNVIAAKLDTNKKHLYYDDMIKNYLATARIRFSQEMEKKKLQEKLIPASENSLASSPTNKSSSSPSSSSSSLSSANSTSKNSSHDSIVIDGKLKCVNIGCSSTASASTNYLCTGCFDEQKQVLLINNYSSKTKQNLNNQSESEKTTTTIIEEIDEKTIKPKILIDNVPLIDADDDDAHATRTTTTTTNTNTTSNADNDNDEITKVKLLNHETSTNGMENSRNETIFNTIM